MGMSEEVKAKADVFLHQHIDKMLEFEYSNCDDPSILWKDLQRRFNHQREVLLPYARDEWSMLVTLNMILVPKELKLDFYLQQTKAELVFS
ncbi:hypothetical protein Tco_0621461 [Tanacetum coccineum]